MEIRSSMGSLYHYCRNFNNFVQSYMAFLGSFHSKKGNLIQQANITKIFGWKIVKFSKAHVF